MVFDKVPALAPALAPGALLRPGRMCSLAEDPAPFTPLRPRPSQDPAPCLRGTSGPGQLCSRTGSSAPAPFH